MNAYHALALSVEERRELTKSAYFGDAWNALKGGLRQTRDNVWNAGAKGLGQMKQDAVGGLKSMATTAQDAAKGAWAGTRNAVDAGIDNSLKFVNDNISQPMQQGAQAIVGGATAAGQAAASGVQQGAQAVQQGATNLGNAAVSGVQQAGQAIQDGAKGALAGARNAVDSGIDSSLNFVNQNISKPMYGAIGSGINAFNEGLAQHGNLAPAPGAAPAPVAPPAAPAAPMLAAAPQ